MPGRCLQRILDRYCPLAFLQIGATKLLTFDSAPVEYAQQDGAEESLATGAVGGQRIRGRGRGRRYNGKRPAAARTDG